MKLEVGKAYRNRNGEKVTIVTFDEDEKNYPFLCVDEDSYTPEGFYWTDGDLSQRDLVAEWEDAPIEVFPNAEASELFSDTPLKLKPPQSIADEAKTIVSGARQSAYGAPERNFDRIAVFWNAYLQNTGREGTLTAQDIGPMMRLLKEARLCATPDHRDSLVDIIGYTLVDAEIRGVEKIPTCEASEV